jgi:hypothetical protein
MSGLHRRARSPHALALVVVAACYSWQLGATPSDAGVDATAPRDSGPGDGGRDVEARDAGHDAARDAHDAASSRDSAPGDAPEDHRPDVACAPLLQSLASTRAAAVVCSLGSPDQCQGKITDACGCPVYVTSASSAAAESFSMAVKAVTSAGCVPHCTTCSVVAWACLEGETDGGFAATCMP